MSTYPPEERLTAPPPSSPAPGSNTAPVEDNVPLIPEPELSRAVVPLVWSKFQNPIRLACDCGASRKPAVARTQIWWKFTFDEGRCRWRRFTRVLLPSKLSTRVHLLTGFSIVGTLFCEYRYVAFTKQNTTAAGFG